MQVECTVSKFAADAKLRGAVDTCDGQETLQKDMGKLDQ